MNETRGLWGHPWMHTLHLRMHTAWQMAGAWSKQIRFLIVLLLAAVGYWLGPPDLAPGAYVAEIELTLDGTTQTIDLPFVLEHEAGESTTMTRQMGAYRVEVTGADAVAVEPGSTIAYRLQITDAAARPVSVNLENINSVISGEGYRQSLPPTGRDDGWYTFSMRIPHGARVSMGLLFAVAMLWVTELVPLAAAALLIPVVVVVAGITGPDTALQPFFHPIVVLFFAGFLLAEGMRRTGVDRIIALNILRRSSVQPAILMLTMMSLTAFLSMWMSNTASVAIIIPIALAVLEKIPSDGQPTGYRRALILAIAYSATVGGIGSAIGTPANILAMTFLNDLTGTTFGFADWFAYGLPVVLLMIPVIWLYLMLVFRVRFGEVGAHLNRAVYDRELKHLGPLSRDQRLLFFVFLGIVGLWLTDRWHNVHTAIVALGGVLLLFLAETIKKDDLNHINWNALLTFGGGLALGNALVLTGVSDWIALRLTGLVVLPPLVVVFLVAGLTLVIGAFISNTACAAMLIPLAIPLAQILHMDPRLLVVIIAIASSIDFALVVGTPPTMMAYSTGYFQAQDIFKRGVVLDFIGILLLSFGVIWIWRLLGMVTF